MAVIAFILIFLIPIADSSPAVYYPGHGNGAGTFTTYTGTTCTSLGASSPCARYNEGDLRIDMDLDTVKYQVQNSQGTWRYIQYDIPNPTNLIPSPQTNPKSLVWMNMYANNTNLRYVMQSHGIKLDIWGAGTPPSNYFNFTYTLSAGVTHRMQNEEIQFIDTVTSEPLWLVKYPTMQVGGKDVKLTFKKDGDKISIHAPDLFTAGYDFSVGWELDPSTQSESTIYISDRHNLTEVNADISNSSALQNLGGGEWLLNANLINNNTANSFYINSTDTTWLKINSTNTSGPPAYWYYLTNGKTEINNTKITSWNTTSSMVENLPVSTWARSAVYASGASSKMNISNSNMSYLGYNAANMYGVTYVTSSGNQIINNSFLQNYYGVLLSSSSNNTLTSNTGTSSTSNGIHLSSSSNNTLTSNTGTSSTSHGIHLYSSSNNTLTSNTGTSSTSNGILLSSSSNNTLTSNTGTSNTGVGVFLYLSSYNILTGNTGTSNTNHGIYLLGSSSYNILTGNTGTSSSNIGIYLYSSSNNALTSNTGTSNTNRGVILDTSSNYNVLTTNIFNTNSTAVTIVDISIRASSRSNRFINTDFTTKPRKIEFYDALTSEFNQSQNSGTSFVNTNLSVSSTTNRNILNWNQESIVFTETFTGAVQANYSISGLIPNKNYSVFNGSIIGYIFTTDAAGSLPDFTINFTTDERSVKILSMIYLVTPVNGITIYAAYPPTAPEVNFVWTNSSYPFYNLMIGTDANFNTVVSSTYHSSETANVYLLSGKQYFWKVRSYIDALTPHEWSGVSNFNLTANYSLPANTTGIYGVVYEKKSDGSLLPIPDAVVNIANTTWSDLVISGTNGYYQFPGLKAGDVYTIHATANGYEVGSTEYVNATLNTWTQKNLFLQVCRSGFTCFYDQHFVQFTVQNIWFTKYAGVTATVYKGSELTASDTQTTGTDGTVNFLLIKDQQYRITFINATAGISTTWIGYPSQTQYYIITDATISGWDTHGTDAATTTDIEVTTQTINDTHAYVNMSYNDTLAGTSNLRFYLNKSIAGDPNNQTNLQSIDGGNADQYNASFIVSGYGGNSYIVKVKADHSTYGTISYRYAVQFAQLPGPLANFDGTIILMLFVAFILFMSGIFGQTTNTMGAGILCGIVWILSGIGVFSVTNVGLNFYLALTLASVVVLIMNINERGRHEALQ